MPKESPQRMHQELDVLLFALQKLAKRLATYLRSHQHDNPDRRLCRFCVMEGDADGLTWFADAALEKRRANGILAVDPEADRNQRRILSCLQNLTLPASARGGAGSSADKPPGAED